MSDPGFHVLEPQPRERRSLFGNYGRSRPSDPSSAPTSEPDSPARRDPPDIVRARCFLHQFLARAFEHPDASTWTWLSARETRDAMRAAAAALDPEGGSLRREADALAESLRPESASFEAYRDDYVAAIGHAARGSSPINEIEYGELRADPLLQPHRLADLAAFYRAFGVELTGDGGERQDHLGVEQEFMAVLAAQEAHAIEQDLPDEILRVNLDAQRSFLRDHLGRWSPTFARRLESMVSDGTLRAMARLLVQFVSEECRRAGAPVGTSDLSLRPADEGASLCGSCGLQDALPGCAPLSED
jgi:DMSO reductase family type II enzyme chaperone